MRAEKRFNFKRASFAPYVDYFNITNHDSVVQPNHEFYSRTPQFFGAKISSCRFSVCGLNFKSEQTNMNTEIELVSEYDRWLYRRRVSRLCAYFIIKTSLLVLLIEKLL